MLIFIKKLILSFENNQIMIAFRIMILTYEMTMNERSSVYIEGTKTNLFFYSFFSCVLRKQKELKRKENKKKWTKSMH